MRPPRWVIGWAGITVLIVIAAVVLAMAGTGTTSRSEAVSHLMPAAPTSPDPATGPPSGTPSPVPTHSAASPRPSTAKPVANLAAQLTTLPADTSQVIIVHASTYQTTHATLETFAKVGGVWKPVFAPMSARIGSKGFSDHHLEYVSNTPVGVFGFGSTMYGIAANPGVKYAYHVLVPNDYWNENPTSAQYNTFEHGTNPGGASEALWQIDPAYLYFAFITYNVPAIAGKGSAIFLHVATSSPTAGCVSLPKADLLKVLTWLDPAKSPRIVLSPDSQLHRF